MGSFCCVTMRPTAVRGRVQSRCGGGVTIVACVGPSSRREGARLILFFPLPSNSLCVCFLEDLGRFLRILEDLRASMRTLENP